MLHVMFGNTLIMSAELHILTNASYCSEKKICSLSNSVFFFPLSHAKMYLAELGLFWSVLSN